MGLTVVEGQCPLYNMSAIDGGLEGKCPLYNMSVEGRREVSIT